MKTYKQEGEVLTLTPGAAVASGIGYLFGAGLFGVATQDVAISTPGEFVVEGVVEIGKTSALAISVGDRLFWDSTFQSTPPVAGGRCSSTVIYGSKTTICPHYANLAS